MKKNEIKKQTESWRERLEALRLEINIPYDVEPEFNNPVDKYMQEVKKEKNDPTRI